MTMTQQQWHPNPAHSMPQPQGNMPPAGWQGPWPASGSSVAFPPGFPGPPPLPPGANVQQSAWKGGHWQFNPGVQGGGRNPDWVPWAPGMAWGSQANYNPYKRVPKPPSPSYWKTQLSDNGLGLEGMVPRSEPRPADTQGTNGGAPQTPWIWNPASLAPADDGDRATPTRDFKDRRNSQNNVRSGLSREGSSDFYRDPSGTRRESMDRPSDLSSGPHHQLPHNMPSQTSSTDRDPRPQPPLGRPSDPNSFYQRSAHVHPQPPVSHSFPPANNVSSRTRNEPQPSTAPFYHPSKVLTQEPESFTSRGELRPTFSPGIVRTPTHYQGPRRGSDDSPYSQSTYSSYPPSLSTSHSSVNGGPHDDPYGPRTTEPLSRQSSLPTSIPPSSSSHLSVPSMSNSDSDQGLLSPLIGATPRPSSGASLSRSHTEPSLSRPSLTTIPEMTFSQSRSDVVIPPPPPPGSGHTTPTSTPNRDSRDRTPTSYSRRDNPLPPPPTERVNPAASAPPVQEPPPEHYSRRVRKGLWNRRGDHMTPNSYVVYAPHDKAYPHELRDYPDEKEGYRDQFGTFVPYLDERPELPTSLPFHGRPPAQPYESFIVYTYYP